MAGVLIRGRLEVQSQRRGWDDRSRGQRGEKMPHAALKVEAGATSQGCTNL